MNLKQNVQMIQDASLYEFQQKNKKKVQKKTRNKRDDLKHIVNLTGILDIPGRTEGKVYFFFFLSL